ncbi:DUF1549 domain-containing protein [bacterium]|nr:DUF1549 domain-containing protein [bacterium]
MKCCVGMTVLIAALSPGLAASAADENADSQKQKELRPASERFASPDTDEIPDFRRLVVPVIGKLGCNSRACHGSFQGQGGFQLSLFGYDFKMDHDGLLERVDLETPADSYALHKATLDEPHRGGKRTEKGTWEYNVLLKWIAGGAKNVDLENSPTFERLEVTPSELRFSKAGETVQLKVVAVWSDGSREDVTCMCRFQSNDDQIADVSKTGEVVNQQAGDTHIVAFYDNGVQPIPVIRPVTDTVGEKYPKLATKTKIDGLVIEKLAKLGVVPSDVAGDTEFLRRVTLDMTGTLPTPQQIRDFVADANADKRARKINELLETPAYAAWWATRFADWTGNSDDQLNNVTPVRAQAAQDWYEWLRARVEKNVPYDRIVEGIVLAKGRQGDEDYLEYCASMSEIYQRNSEASYADRETMPHYWARNNFRQPEDRVIGFAYSFLGIRMQCAQCHKHPFDAWTMQDFHEFKNFFVHTTFRNSPGAREGAEKLVTDLGLDTKLRGNDLRRQITPLLAQGKVVPFDEVWTRKVEPARETNGNNRRRQQNNRGGNQPREARLLGESEATDLSQFEDPREPLMAWMRSNDLMAKALVNRVWAAYFNVGIVEPPDDMALANPPSNKPLLDYLTQGFIDSGYDLKWLHREIANSDTYQRTWVPNDSNHGDQRNFSHSIPRRIPAEVALDALVAATSADDEFGKMLTDVDRRSISIASAGSRYNENRQNYSLSVFGRSIRESNCDCDRSEQPSLLQTVFLQNDQDVYRLIDQGRGGWINQVASELGMRQTRTAGSAGNNSERQIARAETQIRQLKAELKKAKKADDEAEATKVARRLEFAEKQLARLTGVDKADDKASATAQSANDAEKIPDIIRRTYLRTVSREPSADELERTVAHVKSSENQLDGVRDVLWALINTKEFIVNH